MKSDLEDLQTRQRLLAEEEKSSKENIEREKKEERQAIQMERERVLLEAKKERQSAMFETQKKAEVVEEEKKEWELEKKRIQTTKAFEKIVTLNVGGTKYTTSLSTLTKYPDSMLGAMFSGRHALPQQEDGSYFIDRDGDMFSNILSYLRDRIIVLSIIPHLSDEVRQRLLHEAKFYQLEELETILSIMGTYDILPNHLSTPRPTTQEVDLDYEAISSSGKSKQFNHPKSIVYREIKVERASVSKSHCETCFRKSVTLLRCNLSDVSFQGCCFEGPVSFEGCLMQGTVFRNVRGLVTQKVHFAPWQVSQAVFDYGLLEALKANGCIY